MCVMLVLGCEVGVLGGRGAGRQSTASTTHLKAVKDGQRVHVGPQDAHRDVVIQLRKAGGAHSGPRPAHVSDPWGGGCQSAAAHKPALRAGRVQLW